MRRWSATFCEQAQASVVLNATGFAVSAPAHGVPLRCTSPTALSSRGARGRQRGGWRAGTRGLSARDLAMNVALPELDGRVLSRAVAFKTRRCFDPATESNIVGFARRRTGLPSPRRSRPPGRASAPHRWPSGGSPSCSNYPNRDGRIANGVGLDTPASTRACSRRCGMRAIGSTICLMMARR